MTTLSAALAAPKLFGPFYAGDSWNRWKAVLKAFDGAPLDAAEEAFFREVADRDPAFGADERVSMLHRQKIRQG